MAGTTFYIDDKNREICNWLRHVRRSDQDLSDVNLRQVQFDQKIFYVAVRDIEKGEE